MKNLRRALLEMQVAHELELSHVYGEIQSLWDARETVKKFLGGDLAISEVDDLQKENERLRANLVTLNEESVREWIRQRNTQAGSVEVFCSKCGCVDMDYWSLAHTEPDQ